MSQDEIQLKLRQILSEELQKPESDISVDEEFFSLGLDSVQAIFVLEKIEKHFNKELDPLLFWNHPTIRQFANHLSSLKPS